MENPARTALSRAVNRAIAEGAPVYQNIPAVLELKDRMEGGLLDLPSRKVQVAICTSSVTVAIWNEMPIHPRTEVMTSIDLDTTAARALRDHLNCFLES